MLLDILKQDFIDGIESGIKIENKKYSASIRYKDKETDTRGTANYTESIKIEAVNSASILTEKLALVVDIMQNTLDISDEEDTEYLIDNKDQYNMAMDTEDEDGEDTDASEDQYNMAMDTEDEDDASEDQYNMAIDTEDEEDDASEDQYNMAIDTEDEDDEDTDASEDQYNMAMDTEDEGITEAGVVNTEARPSIIISDKEEEFSADITPDIVNTQSKSLNESATEQVLFSSVQEDPIFKGKLLEKEPSSPTESILEVNSELHTVNNKPINELYKMNMDDEDEQGDETYNMDMDDEEIEDDETYNMSMDDEDDQDDETYTMDDEDDQDDETYNMDMDDEEIEDDTDKNESYNASTVESNNMYAGNITNTTNERNYFEPPDHKDEITSKGVVFTNQRGGHIENAVPTQGNVSIESSKFNQTDDIPAVNKKFNVENITVTSATDEFKILQDTLPVGEIKEESIPSKNILSSSGVIFKEGMQLTEFLRKNSTINTVEGVLKYFSKKDIQKAVDSGAVFKKRDKLII